MRATRPAAQTTDVGLLVCAVAVAVLAGWLTGGSLTHLAYIPVRGWPLLLGAIAGVLAATVGGGVAGATGTALIMGGAGVAAVALLTLLARNRAIEGMPLIAAGLLLNVLVVAANGAMPVSLDAAARAGIATGPLADGGNGRHVLADDSTRLRHFGDVVPVPLPVHPEVLSPGDLLVVAGASLLVLAGMRRSQPEPS
jgi:hypothetical protein